MVNEVETPELEKETIQVKDKIESIRITSLNFYPDNPRTHSKDQIKKLANQIKLVGFNQPIIIDEKNQVLVGNGRLEAADYLNMEKVPCIRYDKLNEAQKKQLLVADNKLNDLSDWDKDTLGSMLNDLNSDGMEHYFTPEEMTDIWDIKEKRKTNVNEHERELNKQHKFKCPNCGYGSDKIKGFENK